ncbi:MAG: beta-N-acetylhexosaminidase [Chloroflexi bacterium]|nr:beta-N-acetylhexosaminidase [Chloroflexota bacterium]
MLRFVTLVSLLLIGCSSTQPPLATPQSKIGNQKSKMDTMSLDQKIGQLMLVGFDGTTLTPEFRAVIQQLHIGGVIFYDRNVASPTQVAQLNADLQAAARDMGDPALFTTIDQEGGVVARLREDKGFTEFPGQMAIGATGDAENARRIARALSAELLALGFNMDLTPDLDVNNNAVNPIISTRSFGSDPMRVAEFGVAFIEGMQGAGVIAIGKHFPGHGDTSVDSHVALSSVPHDRARLESVEFLPFRAAMKNNLAGIMSAHVTFPAIDPTPKLAATLSPRVLTDLVRGDMQYDGLVMTDELTMGALATSGYPAPQAAVAALQAGADILLFQTGYTMHRDAHAALVDAVRRGDMPESRVDDALRRVMRAKEQFGLLTADRRPPTADTVGSIENKTLSREVARQAVTLVRDQANNLAKVSNSSQGLLVVETGAYKLGNRLGATTMQVKAQPTQAEIVSVKQTAQDGRVVIVATSDVAKNPQQVELVNALLKLNAPVIVVATRSPYDLLALPDAPTYLAIYGANPPMLDALADVLSGKIKAQGKLPVELPGLYRVGDSVR